jgi:hypothetical protein
MSEACNIRLRGGSSRLNYPIYRLSDKLRRLVGVFESRSQFMESPFGFKNEEQNAAMEECRDVIEELSAGEVVKLIEFYRESSFRGMPVTGNELVGPILFEHWGRTAVEMLQLGSSTR